MAEYVLLEERRIEDLERACRKHAREGWIPSGGISQIHYSRELMYQQVMYFPGPSNSRSRFSYKPEEL